MCKKYTISAIKGFVIPLSVLRYFRALHLMWGSEKMIDVISELFCPPIENRWFQDDRCFITHLKYMGNGKQKKSFTPRWNKGSWFYWGGRVEVENNTVFIYRIQLDKLFLNGFYFLWLWGIILPSEPPLLRTLISVLLFSWCFSGGQGTPSPHSLLSCCLP